MPVPRKDFDWPRLGHVPTFEPTAAREMGAVIDRGWVVWVGHRGLVIDRVLREGKGSFPKEMGWLMLDKGWGVEDAGQKGPSGTHLSHQYVATIV